MPRPIAALWVLLLAAGCGNDHRGNIADLSEEFVYTRLSFSPSTATSTGLHQYKGRNLDDLLDDASPAARGSALLSLELLSRDHPSTVNSVRALLHKLAADGEENSAVRRLAVMALKNGSAQRETIVLLEGLSADDDADGDLRRAAGTIAQGLKRKAQTKR